jgi:hypothetical protein
MTSELKKKVIELIKNLPEDVTLEDIQYHLFVKQKLLNAEKEIQEGKTQPHKQVMKRARQKWLK